MGSHYFDAAPDAPSAPRRVPLDLEDVDVELDADTGMFSNRSLDRATRLLLVEGPPVPDDARELLDLGCGYGPIAVTLALRAPTARVTAVDVNERARACLQASAARLDLTNLEVTAPDRVDERRFDMIWSNPPIRIGKDALQDLLARWLDRLTPDGTTHLVVAKHKGADSLARWLEGRGHEVARRGSKKGFRLLDVRARPT